MQGPLVAGLAAQCAVKLELEDGGQKVAGVGNVGGNVILGSGIKIGFAARYRGRDALVAFP